jgi:DNA invertase Pin-like site-specific DNA recombinase
MHPRDAQQLRSPSLVGACPHQSFDQQAAVLLDQRRPVTDERISSSKSIDTDESNPTVRLLLHILASVADSERELIQKRVRTGITSAKHYGEQLGRKRVMFVRRKALEMATAGASIREICETSGVGRGTIHPSNPC